MTNNIGISPCYQDNWTKLYNGDCREVLKSLPEQSVSMVCTSPPYFNLRDYGTATWEGGNEGCDHAIKLGGNGTASSKQVTSNGTQQYQFRDTCGKCGATRIDSQIGLEQTPDDYIAALVSVFQEVRRVLKDDGTVWLNLGDSYATGTSAPRQQGKRGIGDNTQSAQDAVPRIGNPIGCKTKDLIGIPWLAAFALRSQGFYLRSDIIWSKPNPMPESVTDRPTKAHEYLFLLSKSERYFYNADAIKEPITSGWNIKSREFGNKNAQARNVESLTGNMKPGVKITGGEWRNKRSVWTVDDESMLLSWLFENNPELAQKFLEERGAGNKSSVWNVATKPYPDSHFAVFPPDLIRPCILAGCPMGGTVLDPFAGSGTTLQVAMEQGCKSIGIELNPDYCKLITNRMRQPMMDFQEAI